MTTIQSGLVGRAILASRSPFLHESEARAQGLALDYELVDFTARGLDDDQLGPVVRALAARGFAGFNVTFPFKQAILPLLDELAPSAQAVGAVNTVAVHEGRLVGHNTDMAGFAEAYRAGLPGMAQDRVLQLGAGGAGAAVAAALLDCGVGTLAIADVDEDRAEALARRLENRFGAGRARVVPLAGLDLARVDGVVNTTPIGMAAHPGTPIDPQLLAARHWVADIIYFPRETALLKAARALGCRAMDGSGMVVAQAAIAFEIITGHHADAARMSETFDDAA